jgi:PqqD family protein of HPr-rel-A system
MRWQLADPRETAVLRLDDEALVFNPASWETHFLNESAACVLEALLERPRSVEEIVAAVAIESESTVPEGFGHQVEALLHQLESLGLVRADG